MMMTHYFTRLTGELSLYLTDYRRLDYFVISEKLEDTLCDSVIRSSVGGSDHCPIVLFMAV